MTYVFYYRTDDINNFVTESKNSALIRAGELVDEGTDGSYLVLKYDLSYEDYWDSLDTDEHLVGQYSVRGFIEQFGAEAPLYELSPEEKAFVVMFIEDSVLLAELSRRMDQYRKYTEKIGRADDELRIFV